MVCRIESEHALGLRGACLMGNGLEQLLLAVEIDVERSSRDAGRAGDLPHARSVKALSEKAFPRAVQDLLTLGALLAFRRRRGIDFERPSLHGASPFTNG